jgi:hypothetical protein
MLIGWSFERTNLTNHALFRTLDLSTKLAPAASPPQLCRTTDLAPRSNVLEDDFDTLMARAALIDATGGGVVPFASAKDALGTCRDDSFRRKRHQAASEQGRLDRLRAERGGAARREGVT